MDELLFTLRGDGPTDVMLLPIVRWVLADHLPDTEVVGEFADWAALATRPKTLADQLRESLRLFPCDLLVVHRDAEKERRATRVAEIRAAMSRLAAGGVEVPYVCAVPVRMSEAWLLFDEQAIRRAAGNPNGNAPLSLPGVGRLEAVAEPKDILRQALRTATGLTGRKLDRFRPADAARRVADHIDDFAPLRRLSAFREFEEEVCAFAERWADGG